MSRHNPYVPIGSDFKPDSGGNAGVKGLVPAPAVGDAAAGKFLKATGGWAAPTATAAGVVPVGGIIMWSGTIATIAAPWALCDGTLNAPGPDLRDKFIVGAKQDDAGLAKTNIEGSLAQTGGVTAHSHSGHAALSHAGGSVADHTGFTHALAIANHPDLTHVALAAHPELSLPSLSHADISLPGYTHPVLTIQGMTHAVQSIASRADLSAAGATHPVLTIEGATHPVQSIASRADLSAAGLTHPVLTIEGMTHSVHASSAASVASAVASRWTISYALTAAHPSHPTFTASAVASHPTNVVSHPAWSISPASHPTFTASAPASHPTAVVSHPAWSISPASHPTFTASAVASHATASTSIAGHASSTLPGGTHGGVGSHIGTDYGVHAITQPGDHGTAGTVTHSFTQPSAHTVSAHDSVLTIPSYFALAFIQRMT